MNLKNFRLTVNQKPHILTSPKEVNHLSFTTPSGNLLDDFPISHNKEQPYLNIPFNKDIQSREACPTRITRAETRD